MKSFRISYPAIASVTVHAGDAAEALSKVLAGTSYHSSRDVIVSPALADGTVPVTVAEIGDDA